MHKGPGQAQEGEPRVKIQGWEPGKHRAQQGATFPGTCYAISPRCGGVIAASVVAAAAGVPRICIVWIWGKVSSLLPPTGLAVSSATIFVVMVLVLAILVQIAAAVYGLVSLSAAAKGILATVRQGRRSRRSCQNSIREIAQPPAGWPHRMRSLTTTGRLHRSAACGDSKVGSPR